MSEKSIDKDELIHQLLTDRDRLFRENSRLRAALNVDPGSEKQNIQEQLDTLCRTIQGAVPKTEDFHYETNLMDLNFPPFQYKPQGLYFLQLG